MNSKEIVLSHYPDAKCKPEGGIYIVYSGTKDLGIGYSENSAWISAAKFIRNNQNG